MKEEVCSPHRCPATGAEPAMLDHMRKDQGQKEADGDGKTGQGMCFPWERSDEAG